MNQPHNMEADKSIRPICILKSIRSTGILLSACAVVAADHWGASAIAKASTIKSFSADNSSSTNAHHIDISTCTPLPDGQDSGLVFSYQVLGKTVILGDTPEHQLSADETLYSSNSDFTEAIDSLLAPHVGQEVSHADLRAIQDEVSLLYLQGNYITSWSNCVELGKDGHLTIHVTEGFIVDVNVGRVDNDSPIYIPAENTRLGQQVWNYIKPTLQDDRGLPQRPVNLAQLDERLQALSESRRFSSDQTFSRLRAPNPSFLDNSIAILEDYLHAEDQVYQSSLTREQVQALLTDLERQRGQAEFYSDTIQPGASVLEVDLKVLADDAAAPGDDPLAASLISRTEALENDRNVAFRNYFGRGFERTFVDERLIRFALHSLELQRPAVKAAVVYIAADGARVSIRVETSAAEPIQIQDIVRFEPEETSTTEFTFENNQFEPVVEEEENAPTNPFVALFRALFPGVTVGREELVVEVERFWRAVQNPDSDDYLGPADQLYDLLIRPIHDELAEQGINTLLVAMDADLGFLPLASLYDSETDQYLAEKYQLAIIPSFRALDIRPSNLEQADILAMGTSEFRQADRYSPLTAVPVELKLVEEIWGKAETFRNEDFTLENLRQQRHQHPYSIVHLASHANFRTGKPGDSSIQFWDTTLPLNDLQISTLNFNRPPLELLVLSACQTALGDEQAVLGFAGSFLNADVKSVLASLWVVNDVASLLYMIEFYRNLRQGLTKAEAVQNTQLALLDEQRTIQNLKELRLVVDLLRDDEQTLESLTFAELSRLQRMSEELESDAKISSIAREFTHPFYWSAYTLVGNPW